MLRHSLFPTVVCATLLATVPVHAQARQSIVEVAAGNEAFSTLVAALKTADLVDALSGDGPFTVFAPTNDAFAKLPEGTVESLLKPENRDALTTILTYHVTPGALRVADVVAQSGAATLNGQRLDFVITNSRVTVDTSNLISTDIECTNGVIHVIDTVLMPAVGDVVDVSEEAGSFNTLLAAVKAAGLEDVLRGDGPFTVLAPTDQAFAALPSGTVEDLLRPENRERLAAILTYHVIPGRAYATDAIKAGRTATVMGESVGFDIDGGALRVNDARIVANDIEATNGVIHVIDQVLIPETLPDPAPQGRLIIGINYAHPTPDTRRLYGLATGEGITVTGVSDGAKDAGMKRGDLILSINGAPATLDRLRAAKKEAGAGKTLDLVIVRPLEVEVRVEH